MYSVYIGQKPMNEVAKWCSEHSSKWQCSREGMIYFFPDNPTAFHCKLRWAGTLIEPTQD